MRHLQRPVPAIAYEDKGASLSEWKTTLPNESVEQKAARLGIGYCIETLGITLRQATLTGTLICVGNMERALVRQLMKFEKLVDIGHTKSSFCFASKSVEQ